MSPEGFKQARAIDWQEAHQRLERARRSMEEALQPSPERTREIMDQRAKTLAQVPDEQKQTGHDIETVVFKLSGERYGIETNFIREIARFDDFTSIPGTPNFLVGVTSLHGTILAVFDLGLFLGLTRKGLTDLSRVLVLGTEQPEFGLLADEALGQVEIDPEDIFESKGRALGIDETYLRGITNDALILLDGFSLLADQRFFLDENEKVSV